MDPQASSSMFFPLSPPGHKSLTQEDVHKHVYEGTCMQVQVRASACVCEYTCALPRLMRMSSSITLQLIF